MFHPDFAQRKGKGDKEIARVSAIGRFLEDLYEKYLKRQELHLLLRSPGLRAADKREIKRRLAELGEVQERQRAQAWTPPRPGRKAQRHKPQRPSTEQPAPASRGRGKAYQRYAVPGDTRAKDARERRAELAEAVRKAEEERRRERQKKRNEEKARRQEEKKQLQGQIDTLISDERKLDGDIRGRMPKLSAARERVVRAVNSKGSGKEKDRLIATRRRLVAALQAEVNALQKEKKQLAAQRRKLKKDISKLN